MYNVISIDNNPEFNPTEVCDVSAWNYGKYAMDFFDIIWASPPCTEFSRLKTTGVRDLATANKIVKATLEIIDYFKPRIWFIENPATGLLIEQFYMRDIPYYDVDYCKYSDFGYRKRTRIYTNMIGFEPMICNKDCEYIIDGKHSNTFGGSSSISLHDKYRVPFMLIHKLFYYSRNG